MWPHRSISTEAQADHAGRPQGPTDVLICPSRTHLLTERSRSVVGGPVHEAAHNAITDRARLTSAIATSSAASAGDDSSWARTGDRATRLECLLPVGDVPLDYLHCPQWSLALLTLQAHTRSTATASASRRSQRGSLNRRARQRPARRASDCPRCRHGPGRRTSRGLRCCGTRRLLRANP